MGEIKPLGSEKLKGNEKIQRILELTYYQSNKVQKESSEIVKESKSGVYGVVKEKDAYYVKKGLNENSLDYIGGMFMKNKNKFSSYGEALKKMEFLTEQENIQEATKYVLKQNKPTPPPETAGADPIGPPAIGGEPGLPPEGEPGLGDDPGMGEDPNDFMSVLKKDAGELQQNLNKYAEQLESPEYAEIVNQVLSGVDFEGMEDTDKQAILDKLGGEAVEDGAPEGIPGEDVPPVAQETAEMDDGMGELDGVASLEELIDTPLEDEYYDDEGYGDGEYNGDNYLDDILKDFENPEDIGNPEDAENFAKRDMGGELGYPLNNELKNPLDSDVNNVPSESSDDQELEELIMFDKDGTVKRDQPGNEYKDGKWSSTDVVAPSSGLKHPIDSDINDVSGEASDDDGTIELDLDELTNMVNGSVKETLGKYFA